MRPKLLVFLLLASAFTACKKSTKLNQGPLSEQDAAEILANAILPEYNGLLAQAGQAVQFSHKLNACGSTKDSLISASNVHANFPSSCSYHLAWTYGLNCATNQLNINYSGQTTYDGAHFSSSMQKSATGFVSGMDAGLPNYQLNLSVSGDGTEVKKAVGATTIKSHIELKAVDLQYNKISGLPVSGDIDLTISDASASAYTYTGKFTCTGNKSGQIILNSGNVYPISW